MVPIGVPVKNLDHGLDLREASSDDELLARARGGDPVAFREIVEKHESAVAATVIGMLGSGADADDVGQETFIRLYRSVDRFRGESSLRTHLVRIAMNLSLDALKKRKRTTARELRIDGQSGDADPPLAVESATPRADEVLEQDERAQAIRGAINSLDEKHRSGCCTPTN